MMIEWCSTGLRGRLAGSVRRMAAMVPPTRERAPFNRHHEQILAQQIRLLFEQLPSALFGSIIVGVLVCYVLWDHVVHPWLVVWMAALAVTTLGRVLLWRSYWSMNFRGLEAVCWARRFIIGVFLSGLIWGAAGVFPLPKDALIQQMFVAFVLAGLAAGGMS